MKIEAGNALSVPHTIPKIVQVNATGVMPVIFATTLLSLPQALARYQPALIPAATALGPTGALYLPVRLCPV